MADLLDDLLAELAGMIGIPSLSSGKLSSCKVKLKSGIEIQMELQDNGQNFVMGSDLGEAPLGKYRENIFREMLRANGMPPPRNGIFCLLSRSNRIFMFEKLPIKDLTARKIYELLELFEQKAKLWKDALARGEIPALDLSAGGPGIFGLR